MGGCIPLILPSLDPPQAISYRSHQKSLAYFSHSAPLVLFCFTKRQSQKGGMVQCPLPKYRVIILLLHKRTGFLRAKKKVNTSADVQFSATNEVKSKKRSSAGRRRLRRKFPKCSCKHDLTCFHCLKCQKGGHLVIF